MTSFGQIDANRRNARKSTGPITEEGKHRSRRYAVRHGFTAETVIEVLEYPEDYKAFELSVTADFDAQTAAERELVLRLASLLWRLRCATAIETGLLQIQGEILLEIKQARATPTRPLDRAVDVVAGIGDGSPIVRPYPVSDNRRADYESRRQRDGEDDLSCAAEPPHGTNADYLSP
jgi:hypothetical protein